MVRLMMMAMSRRFIFHVMDATRAPTSIDALLRDATRAWREERGCCGTTRIRGARRGRGDGVVVGDDARVIVIVMMTMRAVMMMMMSSGVRSACGRG